jgi:hypothetical protein
VSSPTLQADPVSPTRFGRNDALAVAFLVLAITVIFGDVLVGGRNFYFRDLTRFYYPMKKVVREIVLAGDFPSWNPFLSGGQPLAANPEYEVFYPPQWLILLPSYDLGYRLHILIHLYIAAIGAYALLRSASLRPAAALFGALSFALGGLVLSSINLLPILFCLAWLPWTALLVHRALEEPSPRRLAAASLVLSLVMLAGEPVTIAQIALLLFGYAIWIADSNARKALRNLALVAGVHLAAVAVACVQIVPAFDHLRDSVRGRGFPFAEVSQWSAPVWKFAELVIPGFMGNMSEHGMLYWGVARYRWNDPFYLSIYFGLLPVALVAGGLRVRMRGWIAVVIAGCASAVLAAGDATPLLRFLYDARIFSSFRYPEKFLIIGIVPLTFFAAFAFQRALDGDRRILSTAAGVVSLVAVASVALLAASHASSYSDAFIRFWSIGIHPRAKVMAGASKAVWTASLIRAAILLALLAAATRLPRRTWAIAALAVLLVDLAHQRWSVAESIDGALFTTPPRLAFDAMARPDVRLFHEADWFSRTPVSRSYFDLPEMYWVLRNGLFPATSAGWGIRGVLSPDIDKTALIPTTEFVEAMWTQRNRGTPRWFAPFMAMSNATHRAMFLPFDQALRAWQNDRRGIQPIVLIPEPSNPRYYFADQVIHSTSAAEMIDLLAAGRWSLRAAYADMAPFKPGIGEVLRVEERSNRTQLTVRSNGNALLVCSITRHKYWRATIDGRSAPLVPVNVAYQGLIVPAGRHGVRFEYDNWLLKTSGVVSGVAVLALLFVLVFYREQSERFTLSRRERVASFGFAQDRLRAG